MKKILFLLAFLMTGCSTLDTTCYVEAVVNPIVVAAQKHIEPNSVVYPARNCSY